MIVADTNLVVYLLIRGAFTGEAERVRARSHRWIVPRLFRSEFLNVLVSHVRFRAMDRDKAIRLFRRGMSSIEFHEAEPGAMAILNPCQSGTCSSYDAEFVWTAQERRIPLVTADNELIRGFPGVAVSIEDFAAGK